MKPFDARIDFRSSAPDARPDQATGDAEILLLNPGRRALIISATGWQDVFPGTLNLILPDEYVQELICHEPLIREPGESVVYPPGKYAQIPLDRKEYLYYLARLTLRERSAPALLRTARVPPYPGLLEAVSDRKLLDALGASRNDFVRCEVTVDSQRRFRPCAPTQAPAR